jgi:hypothetical protein
LKTSIADTEQSLVEIISTINELVLADGLVELVSIGGIEWRMMGKGDASL